VLAELAARLATVVERLRGTPIGQELGEVARRLQEEADALAGSTATDLARTVSRLCEEREELRSAFSKHVVDAAERESALRARCEQIRAEAGATTNSPADALRNELAVALQEEAEASRAARAHLVAENSALRSDLAAERQALRAARAELAALYALHGGGRRARRAEQAEQQANAGTDREPYQVPEGAPCLPPTPPAAGPASPEEASQGEAGQAIGHNSAGPPPGRICRRVLAASQDPAGYEPVCPRRPADFAQRDFVLPDAAGRAEQLPWRAEVQALAEQALARSGDTGDGGDGP